MKIDFKKMLGKLGKSKYVLAVLLVGAVLIMLPTSSKSGGNTTDASGGGSGGSVSEPVFSLSEVEEKMARTLSEIDGAGKVSVILTLKSSSERLLAENEKTTASEEGEKYSFSSDLTTVIISTGSGTQSPVTVKYIYPEYLGAVVVCEGGGDAAVKLRITDAVASLTGLKSDKISVVKMTVSQEEVK